MLTIWGRRSAFNVQKALWAIGELGLPHRHVEAGGDAGGLDDPAFRAMNPHGRIPVIDDDGTVVWESHTIVRYLFARYGESALWPGDPAERSRAERWMDWGLATLQPAFMEVFWGCWRVPEGEQNRAANEAALARCLDHYRLLDDWLDGRTHLAGEVFTMADIPAGTTLHRWFGMGLDLPALPRVEAWYARLAERPAYREHIMRPFDELKGKAGY